MPRSGPIEGRVIIREIPRQSDAQLTVAMAIGHKITVNVPYSGKFAEIRLSAPDFQPNQTSAFTVEIRNLGSEDIHEATALVEVVGPLNERMATLTGKEVAVKAKTYQVVSIPWTPDIRTGEYVAEATAIYDELNAVESKKFSIGEMMLEIISISVDNFRLGGIARFDLFVASNWNKIIKNTFATTQIRDSEGKVYDTGKTASKDFGPYGRQLMESFWDTSKADVGPYELGVELAYSGKTSKGEFEIFVEEDKINTELSGKAVEKEMPGGVGIYRLVYVLVVIVIILVAFNIYFLYKRRK